MEVSLPSSARYIGQCACLNGLLSSLDFEGSNIIIIWEYAFSHCYKLIEVTFSSCLQEICEGAFFNCRCLEIINFEAGSNLTKIGSIAFEGCESLQSFEFPPHLDSIGEHSFNGCAIQTFSLIDTKVRRIGSNAFESNAFLPVTVTPKCY